MNTMVWLNCGKINWQIVPLEITAGECSMPENNSFVDVGHVYFDVYEQLFF